MRRFLRCLAPRHYPVPAYVLFCLALLLTALYGSLASIWVGRAYPRSSLFGLPLAAWRVIVVHTLVALAAIINGFSPKFRAAQRIWAGRTHWVVVVPLVLAGLLARGSLVVRPAGYEKSWDWAMSVLFLVWCSAALHGLVLHVFTCADDPTPTRPQASTAALLRVLGWLAYLLCLVSMLALGLSLWPRLTALNLATASLGALALTHILGAGSLHFRREAWARFSPAADVASTAAAASQHRGKLIGFDIEVKVRGVALIAFWIGAFLLWLALRADTINPGQPSIRLLTIAGFALTFVGGGLAILMPHPAARPTDLPSGDSTVPDRQAQLTKPTHKRAH